MVNGIGSGATSYANASMAMMAAQKTQPLTTSQRTTQVAAPAADSVKLSATAQAHAFKQQGLTVKGIASNMGITTSDVNSYLGISSLVTAGGGNGPAQVKSIASHVQVNGPQTTSKS